MEDKEKEPEARLEIDGKREGGVGRAESVGRTSKDRKSSETRKELLTVAPFSFPVANKASRIKEITERIPNLFAELAVLPL